MLMSKVNLNLSTIIALVATKMLENLKIEKCWKSWLIGGWASHIHLKSSTSGDLVSKCMQPFKNTNQLQKVGCSFYKKFDNLKKNQFENLSVHPFSYILDKLSSPFTQFVVWGTKPMLHNFFIHFHLFTNETAKLPLQIITYRKFWKLYKNLLQICICN